MNFDFIKTPTSHGTGHYCLKDFKIGNNVVFESNILVFIQKTSRLAAMFISVIILF